VKRFALLLSLLSFCAVSYGACSSSLRAKTATQLIEIGDDACAQPEQMIFITQVDRNGVLGHESKVSFKSQCSWISNGFTCKANGSTALAGATYRKTRGNETVCETPNWPEYRCVSGCKRPGVPSKFTIDPYEC